MFSIENFYYILYTNFLRQSRIFPAYFHPFGSTSPKNVVKGVYEFENLPGHLLHQRRGSAVLFYDQEPMIPNLINALPPMAPSKHLSLLANSEHSKFKKEFCKKENYIDWYYFFHGFAALDWYRDYQYMENHLDFKHTFLNFNRLVVNDRSYRLLLVSLLNEKSLLNKGLVSLHTDSEGKSWREEINNQNTKLSEPAKKIIEQNLNSLQLPLRADTLTPQGNFSAHAGPSELIVNQSALWHIVSETVFYYDKLHLTEKIFKPIVSKRPFILVAAPENLGYLKSYGFKTFDRWIDESYDLEKDPDKRIEMIVNEIEKLCRLSRSELKEMHIEMNEILNHNFNHFFGEFKNIIVEELINNYLSAIGQWNNGRVDDFRIDLLDLDFKEVKKRLLR